MDHNPIAASRAIEAQVSTSLGKASLIRARWAGPIDQMARGVDHHLQLSLLPFARNGRGCFPEAWGPNRFEPIGSLFLTPAGQMLHARSECAEQQAVVCNFDATALDRWFERSIDWTSRRLESSLNIPDPEIRRLLFRIGQELRSPGFASDALIELMAGQIALELCRYLRGIEEPTISGGLAPWRLRLIDDYLAEHPVKASLDDLARACQLSVRQLSRAFQVSRGRSIGLHIGELRMDQARRMLIAGMPIKVAAATLGFSSPSNFSTAFQRMTGESPRAYRSRAARH